jgi:hypothetical protein
VTQDDLNDKRATFINPKRAAELIIEADRTVSY